MSDDFVFDGFEPANTTPVPDVLFDQLLPRLHEAELKVILYIIRRTLGFKKTADAISLQQFQKGITTKEGKKLDDGCGLKNMTAITKAIRKLEEMGCIESEKRFSSEGDSATTVYRIRFKGSTLSAVPTTRSVVPTTSNDSTVLRQTYDGVLRETYPQETVIQETVIQETVIQENSAAPADASPSPQKSPSQDSLLEAPLTEPTMNGSWNHEKAVQYAEWCNGKRYSAKMREAQLKAAQTLHKGDSSLTLELFKQAYDERNDAWWKEHKGRLDVTDMKAKEQSSGVVRIYAMLERTQQHPTGAGKAKPSLQVVAPNKEQERPSVLVPKRQSLINFMNLFINAGSVPESYLNKFNDAQAEGIDLPLDKLERVRSLPIQAVRSNAL